MDTLSLDVSEIYILYNSGRVLSAGNFFIFVWNLKFSGNENFDMNQRIEWDNLSYFTNLRGCKIRSLCNKELVGRFGSYVLH